MKIAGSKEYAVEMNHPSTRKQSNIVKVFEELVLRMPNKIALLFRNRSLTFNELNIAANIIAAFLIENELTGEFIGISLNRSPEILISIMGILKAGCAYVFIDPAYPAERVKHIVDNSEIKVLLTSRNICIPDRVSSLYPVYVDELTRKGKSADNPQLDIGSDMPAYMMYTSGTTGRPKGAVLTHGNVLNYINAILAVFNVKSDDVYLHTASFSFSSSVRQWLIPVMSGIPVCIASEDEVVSLKKILEAIKKNHVTIMDTTQMLWRYGLPQLERLSIAEKQDIISFDLRLLIFSGDMLPARLVQQIKHTIPKTVDIINVYGQTEALGAMTYTIPENFGQDKGVVPIGYPLDNTRIKVLNVELKPVNEGELGELYISSDSIGLGYHKNKELTDEVFIRSQVFPDKVERWLKTGDIVRYWITHPIEIVCRTDFQVKIRGVRINLNEIENVLSSHPQVQDCVLTGIVGKDDELFLVALVVCGIHQDMHAEDLKHYLRDFLPEAYIPEWIIPIEKIPSTPNGKINRKAIQEIAESATLGRKCQSDVTFRNEAQKSLYNLFYKVLDMDNIKLTDNFFDIGGQSLRAVELVTLMEKVFDRPIPVEMIYKYPSIEKLASAIENIHLASIGSNLIAIQPLGNKTPFICVHGDDANYLLPKYLGDDIPFYGFFHQGRNGEKIKFATIQSIAEKYTKELMSVNPTGPYVLCGYSIGGIIAHAMAELVKKRGGEISHLVLIDSKSPHYNGKRIEGKFFFHQAHEPGDQKIDTIQEPQSFINRINTRLALLLIKYGYFFAKLWLGLGVKVPLIFRNSYIMGTYRRALLNYNPWMSDVRTLLMRSAIANYDDQDLGWNRYIMGNLEICEIDSDHDTIIREPRIKEVAGIIRNMVYGTTDYEAS